MDGADVRTVQFEGQLPILPPRPSSYLPPPWAPHPWPRPSRAPCVAFSLLGSTPLRQARQSTLSVWGGGTPPPRPFAQVCAPARVSFSSRPVRTPAGRPPTLQEQLLLRASRVLTAPVKTPSLRAPSLAGELGGECLAAARLSPPACLPLCLCSWLGGGQEWCRFRLCPACRCSPSRFPTIHHSFPPAAPSSVSICILLPKPWGASVGTKEQGGLGAARAGGDCPPGSRSSAFPRTEAAVGGGEHQTRV